MDIALQVSGTYDEVLDAARWAEEVGLAALALPDHYLRGLGDDAATTPAADALTQLAGLARDTESIPLVVLVAPITFRHPAVLLKTAVTIDRMSGGRFSLGVGTGWLDREHEVFGLPYPDRPVRFEMLEEALSYIRAGLSASNPGWQGHHYSLEEFPLLPAPLGPIPLVVGGIGKQRTPQLAGRFADEYNVYASQDTEAMMARIDVARAAAREAGRDPAAILLSSAGQVLAGATRAEYDEKLAQLAATTGVTPTEMEEQLEQMRAPRGTFDEVCDLFEAYATLGITRFYLQRRADFSREEDAALVARLFPIGA